MLSQPIVKEAEFDQAFTRVKAVNLHSVGFQAPLHTYFRNLTNERTNFPRELDKRYVKVMHWHLAEAHTHLSILLFEV